MDGLNRRCLQLEDAELGPDAEDPIHRSVTELHRMRVVIERSWAGPLFYGAGRAPKWTVQTERTSLLSAGTSVRRRSDLAMALARVRRTCFALTAPQLKH